MEIPAEIKKLLGPDVIYLGETGGVAAFCPRFDEEAETGLPVAATYKDGQAKILYEADAKALLSYYIQD